MSTIKSSSEHLVLNADGANKSVKFQSDGVEKASINSAGLFTSTTIDATKLTGALPAIDGSNLTGVATDTSVLENNIAMLGFYRASDNSKAKYNLVDQVIDEYIDATGIDAGNSTNELLDTGAFLGGTAGSPTTTTFSYTGSNQTWTVPANVTSATIKLWGAGGGGGSAKESGQGKGGGGAGFVTATCSVVSTTVYSILIGQSKDTVDGVSASPYTNAYGGGGNGGGQNVQRVGGSGGGRTEFSIGGGANVPAGTRIMVAAGGGGGVGVYHTGDSNVNGGAGAGGGGGGTIGLSGQGSNTPPTGGTQVAGGAYGTGNSGNGTAGTAGFAGIGGGAQGSNTAVDTNYGAGGGGGGGYYGGGGGQSSQSAVMAHGGAGGSSYANLTYCSLVTNTPGSTGSGSSGGAVANAGDSDYPGSSVGVGGNGSTSSSGSGLNGGDGAASITFATQVQGGDLTLQSVASTAESVPTTGDIVMLIEDGTGTATINTDIKAYISRDGSVFSSAVTLTDEGTWGVNKRILAAHNVDISGITSGTSMKYKITTHNQSTGSKITKIHATSLAWA